MLEFFTEKPVELIGAATLAIGGAILVQRALRYHRDDAAARIALISPWTPSAARAPQAMEEPLRGENLSIAEREIARLLRKRGYRARLAPTVLLAARASAAVIVTLGFWYFAPQILPIAAALAVRILIAGIGGFLGWLLPALAAEWAAKRRIAAVVSGLPDALELLVICAEAGLALGDGIDRIVVELKRSQPELADELELTSADLKILPGQEQALARLAVRIDVPIVRTVVTTLSQTMRYGTPFAQAMRVVAGDMRSEVLLRMEERANKLPALLTIPMMLFIMPTIFLVIGGPAALKVIDIFLH